MRAERMGVSVFRLARVTVALCLILTLACAGGNPPVPGGETGMMPGITRLSPAQGKAGEAYPIQVTIEGEGFSEEGNIVTFGGIP